MGRLLRKGRISCFKSTARVAAVTPQLVQWLWMRSFSTAQFMLASIAVDNQGPDPMGRWSSTTLRVASQHTLTVHAQSLCTSFRTVLTVKKMMANIGRAIAQIL